MRKVVWLDEAVEDVVRLREFIEPHNREAAIRAAKAIQNGTKILEGYPNIAHPVEVMPDYNDLIIPFGAGNYVLRYRIEGGCVYVIGVRHSREESA
ncbi:MAG: type II toxin-antitoxin system RelE/ParE family toxin [Deltaproteobacteria bacterium]|nr:type II toxin-antitoxin system RelE/ParE family toxin [Deltaproteobacteria bacterium]